MIINTVLRILGKGNITPKKLRKNGAIIGENVHIYTNRIDLGHCFLLQIGNQVTLAANCRILLHDASTKRELGFSKVGRVKIDSNVFVGADAIILPNVHIGSNVIIGAGFVVAKDVPDNSVVVGNPCKVISTYDDYITKMKKLRNDSNTWHTYHKNKNQQEIDDMRLALLNGGFGFDI